MRLVKAVWHPSFEFLRFEFKAPIYKIHRFLELVGMNYSGTGVCRGHDL